ncbi:MAG: NAD-dependent epimerase/dehydratase family protein [Caldisphaera sp.]
MEMKNDKIKVLLTGANGFIGSYVIDNLVKDESYEIGITLRKSSDIWRIKENIQKIESFFVDQIDIDEIISNFKPDIVIHLAVYYKKRHIYGNIDEMLKTNVIFPTKLLDSMIKNNVHFFINTGTFTEYAVDKNDLTTQSQISPANLYSATKVSFEDILKFYGSNYNLNAVTLKLFAPYGYKDNRKKLIPYLINCALSGKVAETSPGDQRWDFIYVKDVADAYMKSINYLMNSRQNYSTFNIGSGENHSIKEIAEIISNLGKKLQVNWGAIPYSNPETFYVKADITSSRNILKWWPKYSIRDGISETYEWYKEHTSDE